MRSYILVSAVGAFLAMITVWGCVSDDSATPTGVPVTPGTDAKPSEANDSGPSCTDVQRSKTNCGTCGRDCGGGECELGVCQPVVVATNVIRPVALAVAGTSVVWLREGAVERCAATGCTGTPTLVTAESALTGNHPGGTTIVTNGSIVAWIGNDNTNTSVFHCPVTGCTNGQVPKSVGSALTDKPTQLGIFGDTLGVTQATGIQRTFDIRTLKGGLVAGARGDVPLGVALDATTLYYSTLRVGGARGVSSCLLSGCGNQATALFDDAQILALAGDRLFATSSQGVVMYNVNAGGADASLIKADLGVSHLATDRTLVAWALPGASTQTPEGVIRACVAQDCKNTLRTIAAQQAQPINVAVADGFVYWANHSGTASINRVRF
jgi:hypothetical protein